MAKGDSYIVGVLAAAIEEKLFVLQMAASDQKAYWFRFTEKAAREAIAAFQHLFPMVRTAEENTLTVAKSYSALTVDGRRAILFETIESGRIALALPDEAIDILLSQLTELRSVAQGSSSKN